MAKKESKKAVGRPSKYDPKYCEEIIEYFLKDEPFREKMNKVYDEKSGEYKEEPTGIRIPNRPPTLFGFAASIDTCYATLKKWKKEHPEFSAAVGRAKAIQADFVAGNAMIGIAPHSFSKFMMQNISPWVDKTENKVSGKVTLESLVDGSFKDKPDE